MSRLRKTNLQLKFMTLHGIAYYALNDSRFTSEKSMCARFVRQVWQMKYGTRFDRFTYTGSADGDARKWAKSGYVVKGEPQPGDLLYWYGTDNEPDGHAAVMGSQGMFYENSRIWYRPGDNGKGMRKLSEKRKPDVIVRLPKFVV